MNKAIIVALILVGLFLFFLLIMVGQFLALYIQAMLSRAPVGLMEIIAMRFRKVDIRTVVFSRIRAVKAGLDIPTNALETHYLAGGRVPNVISAMIAARGARIELPWNIATAIDLAGRDILDWYRSRGPRCPKCLAAINAEAYICWSCKAELESAKSLRGELQGTKRGRRTR